MADINESNDDLFKVLDNAFVDVMEDVWIVMECADRIAGGVDNPSLKDFVENDMHVCMPQKPFF